MRVWKKNVPFGGIRVRIAFVKAPTLKRLADGEAEGCYAHDKATIYLLDGAHPSRQLDSLFHECVHAAFDASGLKVRLREELAPALGVNGYEEEETFVQKLTSHMIPALLAMGWKPPEDLK